MRVNRALTPIFAALAAGTVAVLGFSPADFPVFTLGALAVLIHFWVRAPSPRAAFFVGLAFGTGFFVSGVCWVYISLYRFGAMPMPVAAFATAGFCVFLALFPALAGWAQARLPQSNLRPLAIAPLWVLTEWLRGWILTGFPWLAVGYAAIDTPLAGFAPLGGVYLASLTMMMSAGLLWLVAAGRWRRTAVAAFALIGIAGAALRSLEWSAPVPNAVSVSLLQGNVPQSLKFDPGRYERTLQTYARLAEESSARLIVLPETAVPRFLDLVERPFIERLKAVAVRNGGDLLLGVPLRPAPGVYYNSVIRLGAAPPAGYDKVHLVPFGEFVPPGFGWIVRVLSIPLSDFSRGRADQRPLLAAGERVAVNICYEDAYGAEIVRQLPEATLLVNVSNVAWFGDSLAPAQHLQIARMRALETGRMVLTATNTGITAAIGADGAVLARLPQFAEGRLEVEARGRTGTTPYVRFADWLALVLSAAMLLFFALRGRSR
jgi:apolipoprotein N-acyltransferase